MMEISRERMSLLKQVAGRDSKRGWLVISLRGLDTESVSEIRLDLDLVDQLEAQQTEASRLFDSLASRLPGEGDEERG